MPANAVRTIPTQKDTEPAPFLKGRGSTASTPFVSRESTTSTSTFLEAKHQEPTIKPLTLSNNYNILKPGVSLGQAIFAAFTLYRTKGDQLNVYDYAAFGLTVAPYALMSIVNLLGSLSCPEDPALYLIDSEPMQEAQECGGFLDRTVVNLVIDVQILQSDSHGASYDRKDLLLHTSAIIFGFIPLLIVALISKLDPANSTLAQRS